MELYVSVMLKLIGVVSSRDKAVAAKEALLLQLRDLGRNHG